MENPKPMTRRTIIRKIEKLMRIKVAQLNANGRVRITDSNLVHILNCKDNAARRILLGISR